MVQGKDWQIRISIRKDIEIVAKVPAVTGRIPTDRTIGLREVTIAVAVKISGFPAITDMVGTETSGGNNRSPITSNVQSFRIDFSLTDGFIQETGTEDSKQQTVGFLVYMKGNVRKTINELGNRFLLNRSGFLTLTLRLLHLLLHRRLDVRREIGSRKIPESVDEIIERSNTWKIIGIEPTEDCIEW